jgi:hypothetical protein
MLGTAVAVALIGFTLKAIAAEPAGWFLVPFAAVACIYHVRVHAMAARLPDPPRRLATISNLCLLGALLLQIDFGSWNCGWDTLSGVAWRLGWASEKGCILIRGLPAILLDLALYIPVVVTWVRLRQLQPAAR